MDERLEGGSGCDEAAFFPGVAIRVIRYAVIRSANRAAMSARSATDFLDY